MMTRAPRRGAHFHRIAGRRSISLGALLLCAATVGLAGCAGNESDAKAKRPAGDDRDAEPVGKIINVQVAVLEPTRFSATINVTGKVESVNDAVVSAEEGGRLERFYVDLGAHVTAGQAIAQLDDRLLRAQVAEAEAAAALAGETYERRRRL